MNNLAFVVPIQVFGVGGWGDNPIYMYGLGR